MIAVSGIYENGTIKILEPVPFNKKVKVIITFLEKIEPENNSVTSDLFNDLIGAIDCRKDGSEKHDDYLYAKENL